jgi:hypothetical protein
MPRLVDRLLADLLQDLARLPVAFLGGRARARRSLRATRRGCAVDGGTDDDHGLFGGHVYCPIRVDRIVRKDGRTGDRDGEEETDGQSKPEASIRLPCRRPIAGHDRGYPLSRSSVSRRELCLCGGRGFLVTDLLTYAGAAAARPSIERDPSELPGQPERAQALPPGHDRAREPLRFFIGS